MTSEKHGEARVYVVWVLWLIGLSERGVGLVAGLGKKQVAGIVGRSPYKNRSAMTDVERKTKLDELWAVRFDEQNKPVDGGILDKFYGKFLSIDGRRKERR